MDVRHEREVATWVRGWAGTLDPDLGEDPTDALPASARSVVERLVGTADLTEGREPAHDDYDEVVVLGAASSGILRRLGFVRDRTIRSPVLTVLAGRRAHLGRTGGGRDGDADALTGEHGAFAAAEGWRAPTALAPAGAGCSPEEDPWRRAQRLFPDETSLALLLLDRTWPAAPGRPAPATRLADGRLVVGEVRGPRGPAPVLEVHNPAPPFTTVRVLDAPAIHRATGRARPTTASTLAVWAGLHAGGRSAPRCAPGGVRTGRILVVSNQPYLRRVQHTVRAIAGRLGRPPEAFDVVGPAAPATTRLGVLLREAVHADVPAPPGRTRIG